MIVFLCCLDAVQRKHRAVVPLVPRSASAGLHSACEFVDAELLLRTLLAWLRGEPRVCSMVPIPDEADEDAGGVSGSGAGWLRLPMSITAPYPLAASADYELGLQFLIFRVVQRPYRRSFLGSIGLLPDLGLFCWARPNGQRLACLLAVVDTYGKAIGTGLL
jgi:hypothetical protein